jgi:hypothetical protein
MPADKDTQLTITVTVEQVNVLLNALIKLPFEQVVGIVNQIQSQANAQLSPAPAASEPDAPVAPT